MINFYQSSVHPRPKDGKKLRKRPRKRIQKKKRPLDITGLVYWTCLDHGLDDTKGYEKLACPYPRVQRGRISVSQNRRVFRPVAGTATTVNFDCHRHPWKYSYPTIRISPTKKIFRERSSSNKKKENDQRGTTTGKRGERSGTF